MTTPEEPEAAARPLEPPAVEGPSLDEGSPVVEESPVDERPTADDGTGTRLRPRPMAAGLAGAVAIVLLGLAARANPGLLASAVFLVQTMLALAWLALIGAPGSRGSLVVTVGSAGAADLLLLRDDSTIGTLAGVVALALVASLLHQLARRDRKRVTESLAACMSAVMLVDSMAVLIAVRAIANGREAVEATVAALASALVVARSVDTWLPGPRLPGGSSRSWAGVALGVGAGTAGGAVYAAFAAAVSTGAGAVIGVVVGASAAVADLVLDMGARDVRLGDERRRGSLRPLSVLLPISVVAPVAYTAGRILLG